MNLSLVIMGEPARWGVRRKLRKVGARFKDRKYCYSIRCYSMTGSFKVDRYVADVLLRDLVAHEHSPAAFIIYIYLASQSGGRSTRGVSMSLADLADRTGLSKRAVQLALSRLRRRHLIRTSQAHRTATPTHFVARPWERAP